MRVRIMRGPSGSGKSYFGSVIVPRMFGEDATVVSADHFFIKKGVYLFNPKELPSAHKACRQRFLEACEDGRDQLIVVDNTNTLPTEIAFYYDLATLYTADVEILTVEPPSTMSMEDWTTQCVAMNQHGVPKRSIVSMLARIKKNKLPYYWNEKMITREDGFFTLEGKTHKV